MSKESFLSSGRLDAEYYQPKYEEIEETITNYANGFYKLAKICSKPVNGVEIRDYVKNGTPYLRIGDLKLLEITKNSIVYVDDKSETTRRR